MTSLLSEYYEDKNPHLSNEIEYVDIIHDISPEVFKREYVEKCRPCCIRLSETKKPPQFGWSFNHLTKIAGDYNIPVYDWGDKGPNTDDEFNIVKRKLGEALAAVNNTNQQDEQHIAISQLPIESCPPIAKEHRDPYFLSEAICTKNKFLPWLFTESRRDAIFVTTFRGIHWHNGRDALAQICEGEKRFFFFSPDQTRFLYPKRFLSSPLAWFDETEAVFCSEIPFENGLDVDLERFPHFAKATPMIIDVKAGDALYIPSHWWHFTVARSPSIVSVTFWDAPISRWQFPLALRSLLMKPYRKYLFRRLRRLSLFSRSKTT